MAPFAGAAVTVPALYMAGDRDFVAAVFSQDITKQSAMVPTSDRRSCSPAAAIGPSRSALRRSAPP